MQPVIKSFLVSAMLMCLIGCVERKAEAPRDRSNVLSEEEVKAIAIKEVRRRECWDGSVSGVRHDDQRWFVSVCRTPEVFGGDRLVVINEDGSVRKYIRGK